MGIPEEIEDFARSKTRDQFKKAFLSLETPEAFAELFGLDYSQLSGLIYAPEDEKYFTFSIPKASGGKRRITAPSKQLKSLQRKLNYVLQSVYEPKAATHGFVPTRSTVTNAERHAGAEVVLNVDLKEFFPSINFGRIRGMFMAVPYKLPEEVATVVAQTCTLTDVLPQGAPTSPTVANMICAKLDSELTYLAKGCRATYTRYADDITFSTTKNRMSEELVRKAQEESASPMEVELGEKLKGIIRENGFSINHDKVRLQRSNIRQEVTGLVVNEFVNVPRELVRQVRAMLHAWRKHGLDDAHDHHARKYYDATDTSLEEQSDSEFDSSAEDGKVPRFEDVLRGRIEYIGMVRGKDNSIYRKYRSQYRELADRDLPRETDSDSK
ncbi:reverse transcriptase family protein [Salinibacter ruber]|uniref:reverse transcriptase family protein n=1 Tax=Salinibacter ruber TaxID=146919 RepID=UPI002168E768|nr:RNA-directed DNA polymerase [Salinibacter ruber]